jgi:hypothetical protein
MQILQLFCCCCYRRKRRLLCFAIFSVVTDLLFLLIIVVSLFWILLLLLFTCRKRPVEIFFKENFFCLVLFWGCCKGSLCFSFFWGNRNPQNRGLVFESFSINKRGLGCCFSRLRPGALKRSAKRVERRGSA